MKGDELRELEKILKNMPESLQDFYRDKLELIQEGITAYFPSRIDNRFFERISGQVALFEQDQTALYDSIFLPTQQYLERGGKLLRPMLAALCLEAYGLGSENYKAFLGAIEVMEDSSIMMDDYIDNSEIRRGGPCAHVAHGYPIANVSSCTAYAISHYLFYNNEINVSADKIVRLLNAIAWEHIQMAFGQIEELYWTESNVNTVTVEQYLQETIARCAFLTFRGPLRYAGILADAPEEDIAVLERIGEYMLVGYHLKGDNLDMKPDSEVWGKIAGEDITTGRRTILMNYILQNATDEDRRELEEILNSRTTDEDKKRRVYDMVMKYKVFEYTTELALKYNEMTKTEISKLQVPGMYKRLLEAFSDFCTVKRTL